MQARLTDFLADMDAARDLDAAWSAVTRVLGAEGVERVYYASVPRAWPSSGAEHNVHRSTLPRSWLQQYAERGYNRVDSAIGHCRESNRTLITGRERLPRGDAGLAREFLEEGRAICGRSGLVVPLRAATEKRFGAFCCHFDLAPSALERWFESRATALRLLLAYADLRMAELVRQDAVVPIKITSRETECLLWLACGNRNDRIAERMGVSAATVEMHLANARRKLGAATREQALAKAIAMGLLHP